jgi:chemotaxis protein MotB
MARQRPPADEPSGGSWMDTYGDLVTLLLTFFVLLYSFSSIDAAKWQELVESFTGSPPKALAAQDAGGVQTIELDMDSSPLP